MRRKSIANTACQLNCLSTMKVTGIDIYPIELSDIPQNITLECDDLNKTLTELYPSNEFDVIQSRLLGPGIHKDRWATYVQELSEYVPRRA